MNAPSGPRKGQDPLRETPAAARLRPSDANGTPSAGPYAPHPTRVRRLFGFAAKPVWTVIGAATVCVATLLLSFLVLSGSVGKTAAAQVTLVAAVVWLLAVLLIFFLRYVGACREALGRDLERYRLSGELHDGAKQSIRGASMMVEAALKVQEENRDPSQARRLLRLAADMTTEAEHQISKPIEELGMVCMLSATPTDFFRERFEKFCRDFGLRAHEDLGVPVETLLGSELTAAHRICIEATWNAVKHSGAENLWLGSRFEAGGAFVLEVRDDGCGFWPLEGTEGLGLRFMRLRAEEVGASLEVSSSPGAGTDVRLRFAPRRRWAG